MIEPTRIRIIASFAVMLVVGTALLAATLWALERFAGVTVGSGGVGIVPPLVAAIVAGQRHAMAVHALPRKSYASSVAAGFVAVTVALSAAALAAIYALDPVGTGAVLTDGWSLVSGVKMVAVVAGLALLLWAILRWAYAFGARTQVKARVRGRR